MLCVYMFVSGGLEPEVLGRLYALRFGLRTTASGNGDYEGVWRRVLRVTQGDKSLRISL